MATVSMPHVVIEYADREQFKKRAAESEAQLKRTFDISTERGRVLMELLQKGSTTVVISDAEEDGDN